MNGIHFINYQAFYLLWLIPLLVLVFFYAAYRRKKVLNIFARQGILKKININISKTNRVWKFILLCSGFIFLILALTRPGWNPQTQKIEQRGRDVVFIIDVSKSMLAEDLAPNRLERAKLGIIDCVERLRGDRVALIAFAGTAVLKCPLTLDYGFFRTMVEDISITSVSRGGTNLEAAVRKALDEILTNKQRLYKDIILITDGEDHSGFAVEAAKTAGQEGVRLIIVGLGDENTGRRIPVTDKNGKISFMTYKDEKGNVQEVWTKLDGDTLRQMANATPDGKYLNIATDDFDLGNIYLQLVASAEKKTQQSQTIKRYDERFQLFLLIAYMLFCCEYIITLRKRRFKQNVT